MSPTYVIKLTVAGTRDLYMAKEKDLNNSMPYIKKLYLQLSSPIQCGSFKL